MKTKKVVKEARKVPMIRNTAVKEARWYVMHAHNEWFTRLVIASAIIDTMSSLGLNYPQVGPDKQRELIAAKRV